MELVQRLSAALHAAERALADAAQRAQDALSSSAPPDLSASLRSAASAAQALQDRLAAPSLSSPLSEPARQVTTAATAIQHQLQQAASGLHPSPDLAQRMQQAQQALGQLLPGLNDTAGPFPEFGKGLPPHFGSQAVVRATQEAGTWVSSQLLSLQMTNPQARLFLNAVASQVKAASSFLQSDVLQPLRAIPRVLGHAVDSGAAAVHDASSSALSTRYPSALGAWLQSLAASLQTHGRLAALLVNAISMRGLCPLPVPHHHAR